MPNSFRLLEAARAIADEVNDLLRDAKRPLIHRHQLREAAQSVPANIREAIGRGAGPDRNQFYRFARGSAEEADEHLRANRADERIPDNVYWRLHNRLTVVVKMINAITGK